MPSKSDGEKKASTGKNSRRRTPVKETPAPLVVGLTGTIGSGKSTAARLFSELGVPVFDTDKIGHELLEADRRVRSEIVKAFGSGVVSGSGVDRRALGELVFSDPEKRTKLESIMHPAIMSAVGKCARDYMDQSYVIVEVPLLYEAKLADRFEYVILVKADEKLAVERASRKLGISRDEVMKRFRVQIPQSEKEKLADFVIANNGSQEELSGKVNLLHSVILSLGRENN